MRDAIVRPLEDQLAGAPNLDHLETAIQPGQASIVAVFQLSSDQNDDLVQVQGRVQNAPALAAQRRADAADLDLQSERSRRRLAGVALALAQRRRSLVARRSTRSCRRSSSSKASRSCRQNGTVTPSIQVAVDPQPLSVVGLHADRRRQHDHQQQRPRARRHPLLAQPRDEPRRARRHPGRRQRRRTCCSARRAARRSTGTNAWSTQSRLFRIGDVANVTDTYETQRVFAYSNGIPCVELDIQKSAGTSEVETSKHVLAALPGLRRTYPDVQFTILNVQSTYTAAAADRRDAHAGRSDRSSPAS